MYNAYINVFLKFQIDIQIIQWVVTFKAKIIGEITLETHHYPKLRTFFTTITSWFVYNAYINVILKFQKDIQIIQWVVTFKAKINGETYPRNTLIIETKNIIHHNNHDGYVYNAYINVFLKFQIDIQIIQWVVTFKAKIIGEITLETHHYPKLRTFFTTITSFLL